MKWVCINHCYFNGKRYRPGMVYEGTRADDVPGHFEPVKDEGKIDEEKEIAMLRDRCQSAGIFYKFQWGVKRLEKALGVDQDEDFRKPKGKLASELDKHRGAPTRPKRQNIMKKLPKLGVKVDVTKSTEELYGQLKQAEKRVSHEQEQTAKAVDGKGQEEERGAAGFSG